MDLSEYQQQAARTCPDLGSLELNLLHMNLGIHTEVGEFLDIIKKHIAYGKPLDRVNLLEEIADIMWYLVNEARIKGVRLTYIFEQGVPSQTTLQLGAEYLMHWLLSYQSTYHTLRQDNPGLLYIYTIAGLKYLSMMLNLDFEQGLQNNINKLRIRFPDKFDAKKALNRNLEAERKELEK